MKRKHYKSIDKTLRAVVDLRRLVDRGESPAYSVGGRPHGRYRKMFESTQKRDGDLFYSRFYIAAGEDNLVNITQLVADALGLEVDRETSAIPETAGTVFNRLAHEILDGHGADGGFHAWGI